MKFKQYLTWVEKNIRPDSDNPEEIVQLLACLIAVRLSTNGKLPVACGRGNELDQDIVQAGIVAGLEKIRAYDSAQGSMRQYLYPTIAGAMRTYAWERENRVGDSRPQNWPDVCGIHNDENPQGPLDADGEESPLNEAALLSADTPESLMIAEEDAKTSYKAIRAAIAHLGTDDAALLLKDAQIGYNAAKRREWALELGISTGTLAMRLARIRRRAQEFVLTIQ